MNSIDDTVLSILGKESLDRFQIQNDILNLKAVTLNEFENLLIRASTCFSVDLSMTDIMLASSAGILLGLGNALFKNFIPSSGDLRHKHGVTRSGVDYKVPKPSNMKGSVQSLHRQIGPGHDIFRFKEALDLMSGDKKDFSLWGESITRIMGGPLHSGNMKIDKFLEVGGFKIPEDPRAELINHLLIDFFTKTSLPIPGSSYIADFSPEMSKVMLVMYKEGFNLKSAIGNSIGFALVQLIIHGYTFMKAFNKCQFRFNRPNKDDFIEVISTYKYDIKQNEFNVMMMIAHGSSFLVDTIVTTSSSNYAGLFQLNYASLIMVSKHTVQYLLKNIKEKKSIMEEMKLNKSIIWECNNTWYSRFRDNFISVAKSENFNSITNSEEMRANSEIIINISNNISEQNKRKKQLLKELLSDE